MEPSNSFGIISSELKPNTSKSNKMYYLKYYDQVVAEIYEEVEGNDDHIRYMEILKPNLFFDSYNKQLMTREEFSKWVNSRVRPISQIGFDKLLTNLNIDSEDKDLCWKVLLKTRAVNVKDRMWLAFNEDETYEECSPWSKVMFNKRGSVIESVNRKDLTKSLNLFKTKSLMNVDGACEKDVYRINGNLAIVKTSLQHNTYDCVAEEIAYRLACILGVDCSPAGIINSDLCYSIVDETKDLISAEDLLGLSKFDLIECYRKLCKLPNSHLARIEFLKMCLFDLLTRQLDRNMSNFSFYNLNGQLRLYRLYDNGLCLFSSSKFRDSLEFSYTGNDSVDSIKFVCRELSKLNVDYVFEQKLDPDSMLVLFKEYNNFILYKNKNSYLDICCWILKQQEFIINCLKELGVDYEA